MHSTRGFSDKLSFLITVLMLIGLCFIPFQNSNVWAGTPADILKIPVKNLVRDIRYQLIEKSIFLQDISVTVSENYFHDRDTGLNLPFSRLYANALATAISRTGANITHRDTGDKPYRAVGSYAVDGTMLTLILRIRQMGEKHAIDLAVENRIINAGGFDKKWFKPDLPGIARTLAGLLEDNYSGVNHLNLVPAPITPDLFGQAPLLLAEDFHHHLGTALRTSSWLGGGNPADTIPGDLITTYAIISSGVRFNLKAVDKNGGFLTGASFTVDVKHIPPELLIPTAVDAQTVCTCYQPASTKDISMENPAARHLLRMVNESLAKSGFTVSDCEKKSKSAPQYRVILSMADEWEENALNNLNRHSLTISAHIRDSGCVHVGAPPDAEESFLTEESRMKSTKDLINIMMGGGEWGKNISEIILGREK